MEPVKPNGVVSVDSGSSFLKAYDGSRAVSFEAITHAIADTAYGADEAVTVDGRRYLVGGPALDYQGTPEQGPNREADFHGGAAQYVQICYALARMGVDGPMERLVLSLPYQRSRETYYLEAVQRPRYAWRDRAGEHEVTFSNIRVVPQGVGALRLYERENPDTTLKQALLVDIGSCTTDVVVVRRQGAAWKFVESLCTSWQDVSTTGFFEDWSARLGGLAGLGHGYTWNYFRLMDRAVSGDFAWPHAGRAVDLRPAFDAAARAFSAALLAKVQAYCGRTFWLELDTIILTGGGAALVSYHPWSDPRITRLDTWANAKGQFYHSARKDHRHAAKQPCDIQPQPTA